MLSWHFLVGANQYKSWIAFVDISQGDQHGRHHCQSLIAMKGQLRRDKHTWVCNVQPFELGRDEDRSQIKSVLMPYIHSFQPSRSHPALLSKHSCCQKPLPFCILLRGKDMPILLFGNNRREYVSAEHRKLSQPLPHCITCCTKTKRSSFYVKDLISICKIRAERWT